MIRDEHLDQMIADYLRHNPDFFARHIDLLDNLTIHSAHQKRTLSLVETQLERQRQRIKGLESELTKLAYLARKDQDIFSGLMPLQQQLAAARDFAEGIEGLNEWAQRWDLQQGKILLFRDQWEDSNIIAPQYWLDRKAFEIVRLERFGLRRIYLGSLNQREKTLLFLPEELPIGSVSCCLLGGAQPNALLLFTARDESQFHSSQDTTFLKHLVDIVELHLNRWLFILRK